MKMIQHWILKTDLKIYEMEKQSDRLQTSCSVNTLASLMIFIVHRFSGLLWQILNGIWDGYCQR